jgi:hypothetical protein
MGYAWVDVNFKVVGAGLTSGEQMRDDLQKQQGSMVALQGEVAQLQEHQAELLAKVTTLATTLSSLSNEFLLYKTQAALAPPPPDVGAAGKRQSIGAASVEAHRSQLAAQQLASSTEAAAVAAKRDHEMALKEAEQNAALEKVTAEMKSSLLVKDLEKKLAVSREQGKRSSKRKGSTRQRSRSLTDSTGGSSVAPESESESDSKKSRRSKLEQKEKDIRARQKAFAIFEKSYEKKDRKTKKKEKKKDTEPEKKKLKVVKSSEEEASGDD